MPYDSQTGGFTNNGNMGEFIANAVANFLTTAKGSGGLGWIQQTPTDGLGSGGQQNRLFSRGSVGSEEPPYWFPSTNTKTLYSFTGNGVNTSEETYDQPGNPMNQPITSAYPDITSGNIARMASMGMTTVVGPYDGYWLFSDETASYFHFVLKVNSRQYRHFHVGMLNSLHPDVHADTMYITSHRWGGLSPDDIDSRAGADKEHHPYGCHILPFACQEKNNASDTAPVATTAFNIRSQGFMLYSPGYGSAGYDWWLFPGEENLGVTGGGADNTVAGDQAGRYHQTYQPGNARSIEPTTKTVGGVNAGDDDVLFGWGQVSGYDDSLGTVLFECEPTFTTDGQSLGPVYVNLFTDFETSLRWGPMGQVPDVFRVNMKHLDAEQEIPVGSDTYIVFPMMNKDANNVVDGEGYSGYEGLAYRKFTGNAT